MTNCNSNTTRLYLLLAMIALLAGCNAPDTQNSSDLEKRINLLESRITVLEKTCYAPELGNLMLSIQARHIKLYYAGESQNWELATFLLHEMEEDFEKVEKYYPTHDEVDIKHLLLNTAMPNIAETKKTVKQQDVDAFNTNYLSLTNSCKSYHAAANHPFIVIQVPEHNNFSNQQFKKN